MFGGLGRRFREVGLDRFSTGAARRSDGHNGSYRASCRGVVVAMAGESGGGRGEEARDGACGGA